ncbi:unnamed protein product [Echinostoma caproni]|uniref:Transposase n=1 Tax=Echinostoma caproni TaxID=27848 RepID=A0A183BGR3_9TREM|nr:unnamed protein product [Echinostoma caproni]
MPKTISGCYTSGWEHANKSRYAKNYQWLLYLGLEACERPGTGVLKALDKRVPANPRSSTEVVAQSTVTEGWGRYSDGRRKATMQQLSLGVVKESHTYSDGLVRTVKLETCAGEQVRDIRRVCLL